LPTGTITFLYTDIEGSTRLWQDCPRDMPGSLDRHNALLRTAIEAHGGVVFRTVGDAFCAAFSRAPDAVLAARSAQSALLGEPWPDGCVIRVRMSIHSGTAEVQDGDYVGHTLNRVARILASGHGGQTLISAAAAELVAGQLPADVSLLNLGEHRLRDLSRSEHIYQLSAPELPSDFSPLVTVDAHPATLPVQPTAFIGRQQEVEAVSGPFRRRDVRLVTLTGPGGSGKTRLALEAGTRALDAFPDGVHFVALAEVMDAADVPSAIGQALHVKQSSGQPPIEGVIAYLRARTVLLILDNFEQLISAAHTVSRLLSEASGVSFLVTSRTALRLSGEREYPVPPLRLPDSGRLPPLDTLSQYDAVALFIERARDVRPDFTVTNETAPAVAEICVRLDGLPLAIELAAARIRLFSPAAILKRLEHRLALLTGGARDRPARQQTLRGAIDWSYDLLDAAEQRLFARLSVFAGGCPIEAAAAICDADGDLGLDPLDGISSLAEKSILRAGEPSPSGEPRFVMLDTLREYAGERLDDFGETEKMRDLHFQYFFDLARKGQESAVGHQDRILNMDELAADYDNLIVALQYAMDNRNGPGALRLAGYLTWFWTSRGLWQEGQNWTERALALASPEDFPADGGILLWGSGIRDAVLGEVTGGIAKILQGRQLLETAGDSKSAALALVFAGMFMSTSGNTEAGIRYLEQGLEEGRERGDTWTVGTALVALAHAAIVTRDYVQARRYAEESLAMSLTVGVDYGQAHVTNILGDISRLEGKYDEARDHYERALALTIAAGYTAFVPSFRDNLAWAAHDLGDDGTALALFPVSIREFRGMGDDRGIAECLVGLGCASGATETAVRLFAAGFALLDRHQVTLSAPNERDYRRAADKVRSHLGDAAWENAWAEGSRLSVDEALRLIEPAAESGGPATPGRIAAS
jgi:predicted ATPase/class 3 adenylate cyclase